MENILEVNNLSKCFTLTTEPQTLFRIFKRIATGRPSPKEIWALKDINFKLKKGEKIGLIGNNGSGKTTLLRIISGIYKQTKGTVNINGKIASFLHLGAGLHRDLSVLDNIYVFGAIIGLKRSQINKKLDAIIDFSELNDYRYVSLRDLSRGMSQRLTFSIAKEANSEILILDETLVSGDVGFRGKCFEFFERYKQQDKTLIVASHDMDLIRRFCNRTLLLDKGNQLALGPTKEVVELYLKNILNKSNFRKAR